MINGPKGTPVWFIDHHPMRVFKWSPTFDPYFETPIAAVWCNVIAVPIHLFEISALYAIGSLLGNPIQLDQATVSKTRLSFARICVEIDITKPPTEEVVLDILGKETILKVKWGKIPLYCRECKHVGHTSRNCHAMGRKEETRNNLYSNYVKQPILKPRQPEVVTTGKQPVNTEKRGQQVQGEQRLKSRDPNELETGQGGLTEKADKAVHLKPHTMADFILEEGFTRQGRRGRKGKQTNDRTTNIPRASSADKILLEDKASNSHQQHMVIDSLNTDHLDLKQQAGETHRMAKDESLKLFEKPNYFAHLEQEGFAEDWVEEDDEMDEEARSDEETNKPVHPPEGNSSAKPPNIEDKAGAATRAKGGQMKQGSSIPRLL